MICGEKLQYAEKRKTGRPDLVDTAVTTELADPILLKTVPPRLSQSFLARQHLSLDRIRLSGMDLIELSAPHGFGKTSQLAQWYREALVAGSHPIWLSLDARDDPSRLIRALTQASIRAGGGALLSRHFVQWIGSCADPIEAVTAWLAELARSVDDMLLLIDDVDHAPAPAMQTLEYLLANAPPNLRIALSGRPSMSLALGGALHSIPFIRITARDLRLREDETIRLVQLSLRDRFDADLAARIHALTEGWPLGVRLAVASQVRSASPVNLDHVVTADIGRYFLDSVIDRLPVDTVEMLVDIARLEPIHADLCRTLIGGQPPVGEIERLAGETPIFSADETGQWYHLHPSAREVLVPRQEQRSDDMRREQALRARDWYSAHGLLEEAAHQARLGGDNVSAITLAESSMRAMTHQGRNSEVLEWYARILPNQIADHPGFWAPAGWSLSLSNRFEEARKLATLIKQRDASSEAELYEADLILAACAGFNEDFAAMEAFASRWPTAPPWAGNSENLLHAVALGHNAILNGRTEIARRHLAVALHGRAETAPASLGYAEIMMGLSYNWEGKAQLARERLGPMFEFAGQQMDSRNRIVSMIATSLASACLGCGESDEARRHLSLRIRMIEQHGVPDIVIAAFTALAELADEEGRQDQAAVQYASLAAEGRARASLRMEAAAYFGLARLHARHGRVSSARQEVARLEALVAGFDDQTPPALALWCELHATLARALASDAAGVREAEQAERNATIAIDLANQLNRGAEVALSLFLRARARCRLLADGDADRTEAVSICEASGLLRLRNEFTDDGGKSTPDRRASPALAPVTVRAGEQAGLTPRENDILVRLVNHMTNKEIALSTGLGEETVKWHLKNLFQKLDAGDRKSAVHRARVLGMF